MQRVCRPESPLRLRILEGLPPLRVRTPQKSVTRHSPSGSVGLVCLEKLVGRQCGRGTILGSILRPPYASTTRIIGGRRRRRPRHRPRGSSPSGVRRTLAATRSRRSSMGPPAGPHRPVGTIASSSPPSATVIHSGELWGQDRGGLIRLQRPNPCNAMISVSGRTQGRHVRRDQIVAPRARLMSHSSSSRLSFWPPASWPSLG